MLCTIQYSALLRVLQNVLINLITLRNRDTLVELTGESRIIDNGAP